MRRLCPNGGRPTFSTDLFLQNYCDLYITTRTIVFRPSFVEQALSRFLRAVKDRLEIFREGVMDVDILGKKAGDCIGN